MKIICGVDVSKARLDACIEPGAIFASFDNDPERTSDLFPKRDAQPEFEVFRPLNPR
jgi:hypothetical protein